VAFVCRVCIWNLIYSHVSLCSNSMQKLLNLSKHIYFVSQYSVFHLFDFNASGTICLSDLEMGHVLKYSHLHNDLNKNKKSIWCGGVSNLNYMVELSVLLCFKSSLTNGTKWQDASIRELNTTTVFPSIITLHST